MTEHSRPEGFFNKVASTFDRDMKARRWRGYETLGNALTAYPGEYANVVDLGAGTGSTIAVIKEHTDLTLEKITAVDISTEMLGELERKHKDDPRVQIAHMAVTDYLRGTVENGETGDLITAMAVFHFMSFSEVDRAIWLASEYLEPGGRIMGTFDPVIEGSETQPKEEVISGVYPDVYCIHPDQLIESLALNGLQLKQLRLNIPRPRAGFVDGFFVAEQPTL